MVARPLRSRDAQPFLLVSPTSVQISRDSSDVLPVNTYAPEPNEQHCDCKPQSRYAHHTVRGVASKEDITRWGYDTPSSSDTQPNLEDEPSECHGPPSSTVILSAPTEYSTAVHGLQRTLSLLAKNQRPMSTAVYTPLTADSVALLARQLALSPTCTSIDSGCPTLSSTASDAVRNEQPNQVYLSELQGIVHPPFSMRHSVEDESQGCETPTPPYSTWPTATQEAARLDAQKPLARIAHPLSGSVSEYSAEAGIGALAHDKRNREVTKQFHDEAQIPGTPGRPSRQFLEGTVEPSATEESISSARLSDPREVMFNFTSNVKNTGARYSQSCRVPNWERSRTTGPSQTSLLPDERQGSARLEPKRWHSLHNPPSSVTFHGQMPLETRVWSSPPPILPAYSPDVHNAQQTNFCQVAQILQQGTTRDVWQSRFNFEHGASIMVCNFCMSCVPTQEFKVRCNSSLWQVSKRFVARSHKSSLSPHGQAQYGCVFCPTKHLTFKSRNELWAHLETHSAVAFENDPDVDETTLR